MRRPSSSIRRKQMQKCTCSGDAQRDLRSVGLVASPRRLHLRTFSEGPSSWKFSRMAIPGKKTQGGLGAAADGVTRSSHIPGRCAFLHLRWRSVVRRSVSAARTAMTRHCAFATCGSRTHLRHVGSPTRPAAVSTITGMQGTATMNKSVFCADCIHPS